MFQECPERLLKFGAQYFYGLISSHCRQTGDPLCLTLTDEPYLVINAWTKCLWVLQ